MEEAGVKKGVLDALIKVNLGLRERRLSRVQVSAIHSRGFHVAFNVTADGRTLLLSLESKLLLLLLIQLRSSMHNDSLLIFFFLVYNIPNRYGID